MKGLLTCTGKALSLRCLFVTFFGFHLVNLRSLAGIVLDTGNLHEAGDWSYDLRSSLDESENTDDELLLSDSSVPAFMLLLSLLLCLELLQLFLTRLLFPHINEFESGEFA